MNGNNPLTPLDKMKLAYQSNGAKKIKPKQHAPTKDIQNAIEAIKDGKIEPKALHPLWFLRMGFCEDQK